MTSQQTLTVIIPNTNSLLMGDILRNLKRQTIDMAQAEVLSSALTNLDW